MISSVQAPVVFATYVHQLDPILFQLSDKIALRWYGLAYLAGFFLGYLVLKKLAERKLWVLAPEKTADFIAAAALLGVFLGGRLGYVLFYHIPREGFGSVLADPFLVFRVWEGGMASHGGILGLAVFTFWYAKKHKVSWAGLADGLCVVGPIGLLCGRIANFINGELYGRVADGVSWAVKFPGAFMDSKVPESGRFDEALSAAMQAEPVLADKIMAIGGDGSVPGERSAYFFSLLDANRNSDAVTNAIAPFLENRHPSQLYEGFLEGGLIFLILIAVRLKFPKLPYGVITGLFFALYATFRIFVEQFREPDAAWVIEGYMTQGQFLSFFLYIFAAIFFAMAWRGRGKAVLTGG